MNNVSLQYHVDKLRELSALLDDTDYKLSVDLAINTFMDIDSGKYILIPKDRFDKWRSILQSIKVDNIKQEN